jgi:hypothetical protein
MTSVSGAPGEILTLTGVGGRHLLVFLRRDLIGTGRQPDLHELAFLVGLGFEPPVVAFGLDDDLRAFDRLARSVFHHATDHAGRLGRGRQRDCHRHERGAGHQAQMPAVHWADHGTLLQNENNFNAPISLQRVAIRQKKTPRFARDRAPPARAAAR